MRNFAKMITMKNLWSTICLYFKRGI